MLHSIPLIRNPTETHLVNPRSLLSACVLDGNSNETTVFFLFDLFLHKEYPLQACAKIFQIPCMYIVLLLQCIGLHDLYKFTFNFLIIGYILTPEITTTLIVDIHLSHRLSLKLVRAMSGVLLVRWLARRTRISIN